jgi:hypothetical protein
MVPGLDQRRLPWTHSHLLAAFIAMDEGLIEPPPAWRVLLRSRWSGPEILEPALLALLRAALPDGEVDLVGWDFVSLWLSLLRWRTHNHATAPTAQTLSASWRHWGLPAVPVSVSGKPGRSIVTTNYRMLAHLVAQPRRKRGLRPPQAPRPGYVQRIMFPDAPPRPSARPIYARGGSRRSSSHLRLRDPYATPRRAVAPYALRAAAGRAPLEPQPAARQLIGVGRSVRRLRASGAPAVSNRVYGPNARCQSLANA